ncbi:hypothetical protein RB195_015486 [Necator americanus]|uniref:Uncharacterized protein n=1 Tax=Necator americanus TaxID=51031 RepID=A0ABR1E4U3_NECAM
MTEVKESSKLPKQKKTMMTICTYNVRTIASIEDLMMQARMIKCDIIGLSKRTLCLVLNTAYDTREELFLGTATVEELVELVSSSTGV